MVQSPINCDDYGRTARSKQTKHRMKHTDQRICEMIQNWKTEGRAFSNLSNEDGTFFNAINKTPLEVGVTSQTGSDLLYYDTSIFNSDTDAIKNKPNTPNQ